MFLLWQHLFLWDLFLFDNVNRTSVQIYIFGLYLVWFYALLHKYIRICLLWLHMIFHKWSCIYLVRLNIMLNRWARITKLLITYYIFSDRLIFISQGFHPEYNCLINHHIFVLYKIGYKNLNPNSHRTPQVEKGLIKRRKLKFNPGHRE